MKAFRNQRGSILLTYTMISLLMMGSIFWYAQWSSLRTRKAVQDIGTDRALQLAESGVEATRQWLKSPDLNGNLPVGSSATVSGISPDGSGRYELSLYRKSSDSTLVQAFTTSYYYVQNAPLTDPLNGRSARSAIIQSKFRVTNASQFIFALPNDLQIDQGAALGNGILYARDLKFESGAPITVGGAFYYSSCMTGPPWIQNETPPNVTFLQSPAHAQQLGSSMNFVALDSNIRATYQNHAAPTTPTLSGTVAATNGLPVYYYDGDVQIGGAGPLTVSGVYVVYTTGSAYIHSDITMADAQSWIAVLSEKDIRVASDAPGPVTLNGNFFSNRKFTSDGLPRNSAPSGNITINGGVAALENIFIGPIFKGQRTYTYKTSSDPNLLLPNFTEIVEYKIVQRGRN